MAQKNTTAKMKTHQKIQEYKSKYENTPANKTAHCICWCVFIFAGVLCLSGLP